ncbi:formyltransferase family protein [Pelobacter propionicus]|uniref:Methionyl-tRNA formyltransferase n=1 Tax=Pelobacter propionicus (strain DSM 2379 / NBRC 103807 / OttBd1) TaxID=338966 RepID=A1AK25_PELPD|nr:formyltransferase family protein [Pelobacter propionicus]ABK97695.1 Methionyl-tRNA formyltransferase [Pelobacter propionicus DSM 2379]
MRIAVLCSGSVLQPVLEALYSQGLLAGVAVPAAPAVEDPNLALETVLRQARVSCLRVDNGDLTGQMAPWLRSLAADALCCMGFPRKLPADLLTMPPLGCYNFHGGPLPQYRGPDPVFWQIRNREVAGAITVHRMTPRIDSGAIAHEAHLPIGTDDTYGLWMQRLGGALPRVMIEFVQQLAIHGAAVPLREQDPETGRYFPRPTDADRTIDWSWGASAIDALVRACNPVYGGALTTLHGVPVRLLEVSPLPAQAGGESTSGTVVTADAAEGLRVACGTGELLRLELLYGMEGFFSGPRLARIFGLKPGQRLA